jgi:hypothetical protein
MSTILVNTLTGTSTAGSIAVTGEGNSTTTNLQQGLAKAWINKPADGASINDSFNISSLDDDGTGDFGVHYANDFSSVNYCWSSGNDDSASGTAILGTDSTNGGYATGSTEFETFYVNSTNNRTNHDLYNFISVVGDLA